MSHIYKRQLYGISDLDRTVRHKALSDIYEVLGLKTLRGRVSVTRDIFDHIDRYHIGNHAQLQSLAQ